MSCSCFVLSRHIIDGGWQLTAKRVWQHWPGLQCVVITNSLDIMQTLQFWPFKSITLNCLGFRFVNLLSFHLLGNVYLSLCYITWIMQNIVYIVTALAVLTFCISFYFTHFFIKRIHILFRLFVNAGIIFSVKPPPQRIKRGFKPGNGIMMMMLIWCGDVDDGWCGDVDDGWCGDVDDGWCGITEWLRYSWLSQESVSQSYGSGGTVAFFPVFLVSEWWAQQLVLWMRPKTKVSRDMGLHVIKILPQCKSTVLAATIRD